MYNYKGDQLKKPYCTHAALICLAVLTRPTTISWLDHSCRESLPTHVMYEHYIRKFYKSNWCWCIAWLIRFCADSGFEMCQTG
jgi:hypothetical protein